jgi:hypothetical protein
MLAVPTDNSYVINTRINGPLNHSKEEKKKILTPLQTTEPQLYISEPIILQTTHSLIIATLNAVRIIYLVIMIAFPSKE